ncbi:MAG: hypothetical protein M5U34_39825 [Chloroflexi bacterium]|nr:hypothetical protein [Chloroflexota bacterium]
MNLRSEAVAGGRRRRSRLAAVVVSPMPLEVVEQDAIKTLIAADNDCDCGGRAAFRWSKIEKANGQAATAFYVGYR